jgi:hypothetical protein
VTDKRQSILHKQKINRLRGMQKTSASAVDRALAEASAHKNPNALLQMKRLVDKFRYPPPEIRMDKET